MPGPNWNPRNFEVRRYDPKDHTPNGSREFRRTDPEYNLMMVGVNLALTMLHNRKAHDLMVELGMRFKTLKTLSGQQQMQSAYRSFFNGLLINFPTICVNYDKPPNGELGYGWHDRQSWSGTFNAADHSFNVSGELFNRWMLANREKGLIGCRYRYEQFCCMFAVVITHELTHVFITSLIDFRNRTGRRNSTTSITSGHGDDDGHGESGLWLEDRLLGGTLEWYLKDERGMRNPHDQAGIPVLFRRNDSRVVSPTAITELVAHRLTFPLQVTGGPFNTDRAEHILDVPRPRRR